MVTLDPHTHMKEGLASSQYSDLLARNVSICMHKYITLGFEFKTTGSTIHQLDNNRIVTEGTRGVHRTHTPRCHERLQARMHAVQLQST